MEILPLNRERIQDANPTNEPFAMIGPLGSHLRGGKMALDGGTVGGSPGEGL